MARDPKFALEVMIAYLRLATRDGGLPLDTPSGRAYTRTCAIWSSEAIW
ncbi:hypothetical protein [Sphingomonas chungangi]|nr:hypothetical protein [Sphingomonas chungangi]